ncbi:MAG: RHS repeat-associated core domain-containing protein, partial [Armatimonadetes bacterium]|nr:RHS repeat-associated core domain-containing protein [Armatimonadota bacterium]
QFDPLGDAVLLLDGTGAVTAHQLHDAWGNPLMTAVGPHGYRARYGYYTDQETGLVALAYRYYAPGVGRFLNRDPVGFEGGVNLYGYAVNHPVGAHDPSGRRMTYDHCAESAYDGLRSCLLLTGLAAATYAAVCIFAHCLGLGPVWFAACSAACLASAGMLAAALADQCRADYLRELAACQSCLDGPQR